MKIHFSHSTRYKYSKPVFLLPQLLRLRPREDGFQRLLAYRCTINPLEHHQAPIIDFEGNTLLRAWFELATDKLEIKVEGVVETTRDNPYDFILDPDSLRLPIKPTLGKRRGESHTQSLKVKVLAAQLLKASGTETMAYINAGMKHLHTQFKRQFRLEGQPWNAEETLRRGEGSCRDLAVLFMALMRAQGLQARFVSGYYLEHPERRGHDLHAWAEVFLPGGGWRGFDPTAGLACAASHITLSATQDPLQSAPVEGLFRGTARASLESSVELKG